MYMSYGRYDICMVFRVARHAEPCKCHNDRKTYTWRDVILYKRSMIRVFVFEQLSICYILEILFLTEYREGIQSKILFVSLSNNFLYFCQ